MTQHRKLDNISRKFLVTLYENEIRIIEIEELFKKKTIDYRTLSFLYEGLYLNTITAFEKFIENAFLFYIRYYNNPNLRIFVKDKKNDDIYNKLMDKRKYIGWLPYNENTCERAKLFFKNGIPFANLNRSQMDDLMQIIKIRNVIAHKSTYSWKEFQNFLSPTLPKSKKNPIEFLRTIPNRRNGKTKFQYYIVILSEIRKHIAEKGL